MVRSTFDRSICFMVFGGHLVHLFQDPCNSNGRRAKQFESYGYGTLVQHYGGLACSCQYRFKLIHCVCFRIVVMEISVMFQLSY